MDWMGMCMDSCIVVPPGYLRSLFHNKQGLVDEFRIPQRENPKSIQFQPSWRFANGMFALVLSFGLLLTSLRSRKERSRRYVSGSLRGFIADYGVPLMVLVWTAVSYIPAGTVPKGIPRRLFSPNPWSPGAYDGLSLRHGYVYADMLNVLILYVIGAVIPATMIAVLYYFDLSVASQLAQQKELNLRKPPSFHYDLLLLGFMVCNVMRSYQYPSIQWLNGVIPQSPMHTKTLATLKASGRRTNYNQRSFPLLEWLTLILHLLRDRLVPTSRKCMRKNASLGQVYGSMQEAYQQMQSPLVYQEPSSRELKDSTVQMASTNINVPLDETVFDVEKEMDDLLPVEVKEQRLSNLLQSTMVGGCVAAMPFLKKIPTSVLWGYLAFMAIESLPDDAFAKVFQRGTPSISRCCREGELGRTASFASNGEILDLMSTRSRDSVPNSSPDSLFDTGTSISRSDARGLKYNLNSAAAAFRNSPKTASNQKDALTTMTEGPRPAVGSRKQAATYGSVPSAGFSTPASAHALQGRNSSGSIQAADNLSDGKVLSHHNQFKVALPANNGLTEFGSGAHGWAAGGKLRPKIHVGRGHTNAQGNIIIHTDQYNKDYYPVEYADAKSFVIKSYSEDDVHKGIKYNVWSSTPHGNKKLNNAYEDAQRIAVQGNLEAVNVSGQFCGVAEMTGPVDFNADMDFWQQDKWSGSFPFKWHIVKQISNASLRHIILENNENRPVTNSRDTQGGLSFSSSNVGLWRMLTLYLIEFYSGGSLGIEMYNVPEHGNNETYMELNHPVNGIFGVDGPDVQCVGTQNESLPYGAQQHYSVPPYQNAVSSPAYIPVFVQPDNVPNSSPDLLFDTGTSFSRSDARGLKYNFNSASGAFPNSTKTASTQKNPLTTMTEWPRPTIGPSKQAATYGSLPSASFSSPASAQFSSGIVVCFV
ncbi:hypothetical protein FEM48_Zijuj12G0215000 [Ziziphus jujuba var. spinosa]|uniref:YTH domain-containing protein n=1 Tax=Ziziphus jujuba var. spinosa TaxID=714518 RepID=A0A978UFN4_ZIZJJ|nr:hypothetical protein FEM48_Zijuj12G0215000 [Ziziphus jujuba var. spinosa]